MDRSVGLVSHYREYFNEIPRKGFTSATLLFNTYNGSQCTQNIPQIERNYKLLSRIFVDVQNFVVITLSRTAMFRLILFKTPISLVNTYN